tara:strand:- start:360 stop:779 length:420 start_codon:yes stop_codon:yes gene_type:complete
MLKFEADSAVTWTSSARDSKGPMQVKILGETAPSEYDHDEVGQMYDIELPDGTQTAAFEDELSLPEQECMNTFTSIPDMDGLFWYFSNTGAEPQPVMINRARWGRSLKSFNGAQQSWLRDGEYLIGPQPAPAPRTGGHK